MAEQHAASRKFPFRFFPTNKVRMNALSSLVPRARGHLKKERARKRGKKRDQWIRGRGGGKRQNEKETERAREAGKEEE